MLYLFYKISIKLRNSDITLFENLGLWRLSVLQL